ncbi:MAG: hypothetical protein RLP02_01860 [Coleofasciculus sp. C2-GNP5-27]
MFDDLRLTYDDINIIKDIQDKESHRWLTTLDATQTLIPPETTVVTVADREADSYDLFVRCLNRLSKVKQ